MTFKRQKRLFSVFYPFYIGMCIIVSILMSYFTYIFWSYVHPNPLLIFFFWDILHNSICLPGTLFFFFFLLHCIFSTIHCKCNNICLRNISEPLFDSRIYLCIHVFNHACPCLTALYFQHHSSLMYGMPLKYSRAPIWECSIWVVYH